MIQLVVPPCLRTQSVLEPLRQTDRQKDPEVHGRQAISQITIKHDRWDFANIQLFPPFSMAPQTEFPPVGNFFLVRSA